jgi:hypothetical protein
MRSHTKLHLPVLLATGLLAVTAIEALGADSKTITFVRPGNVVQQAKAGPRIQGPGGATKMKVIMTEAGPAPHFSILSGLTAALVTNPAGCPTPTVAVNVDTVWTDWGTPCPLPGDCVTLHFTTPTGPLAVRRSFFTDGLGDSIAPATPYAAPGLTPWGAAALTALLALAGGVAVVRRRRAAGREI